MHINRLIWHLLIVLLLNHPVQPCTVIAVKGSSGLLVGNNEDASPEYPTKVWFLQPEAGPYGYLISGFADSFAQGGLNDQGLVVGWAAGYETDWSSMPDKPYYPDNLTEKMMAECASVEEALVIFRLYNVPPPLQYARCMLADKEKSAIILWQNNSLRIVPWDGRKQVLGYGEGRAEPRLARSSAITVPELQSVMTQCIQRRPARTLYSVVYDPENRVVTVFSVYNRGRKRRSLIPCASLILKRIHRVGSSRFTASPHFFKEIISINPPVPIKSDVHFIPVYQCSGFNEYIFICPESKCQIMSDQLNVVYCVGLFSLIRSGYLTKNRLPL